MLNPAYSKSLAKKYSHTYTLQAKDISLALNSNYSFDTGRERRIYDVFTEDVWNRITGLELDNLQWEELDVLDLCAGTGYLSYHLLKRVTPKSLTLLDISQKELTMAKSLLDDAFPDNNAEYLAADFQQLGSAKKYDIIIGNSFLHHFYDMPSAIKKIYTLLNPSGVFATLHEPTPMAVAVESGQRKLILKALFSQADYMERMRFEGDGVRNGEGCDVWIFQPSELKELFKRNGFEIIGTANSNFLKPYTMARHNLHAESAKPELSESEQQQIRRAIRLDHALKNILPKSFWGSVSLKATK